MTTLRRIFTGTALLAMACGLASASSIISTCTGFNGATELGSSDYGASTVGTVSCTGDGGLNPAWITGIEITVDGAILSSSTIDLTNNDNVAHVTNASSTEAMYLDNLTVTDSLPGTGLTPGFGSPLFTITSSGVGGLLAAGGSTGAVSVSGSVADGGACGTILGICISSANWAYYESSFSFVLDSLSGISLTGGGGFIGETQSTFGSEGAVIEYDYTIPSGTPEPTTLALMGSALIGLGLIGKRFKKS